MILSYSTLNQSGRHNTSIMNVHKPLVKREVRSGRKMDGVGMGVGEGGNGNR